MGELRERMHADLKIGGYSPSTAKIYLMYARQFARFHMRSPAEERVGSPKGSPAPSSGPGESGSYPQGGELC